MLGIGKDTNYTTIEWPILSHEIANRNLLVTGRTGEGKTYAIETMISKSAKLGIPTIIFDYSNSFTIDRLDKRFVELMNENIIYRHVYFDGINIDPLKIHNVKYDSKYYQEKISSTCDRVVDIVGRVFKLGDMQKGTLYRAISNGFIKDGRNFNFNSILNELEIFENEVANTIIAKISSFVDKNIFLKEETICWGDILHSDGNIYIIQLDGFSNDMKMLITDFILWDIWYWSQCDGDEKKPFITVLDECQNLNFGMMSPIYKILTEGRKFGWSTWLSTQILTGVFDKRTLNIIQQASLKLYFKPTSTEVGYVSSLLCNEKKILWKEKLQNLQKGYCVAIGDLGNGKKLYPPMPISIKIDSL